MRYNCVVGSRRSGTSMLMLALRQAGIPTLGLKYVRLDTSLSFTPTEEQREGNLNGYWEMGDITLKTGLQAEHKDLGMNGDLIKIITECIWKSDPTMINKVIYIERDTNKVIKSLLKAKTIVEEEAEYFKHKIAGDKKRTFDYLEENQIPVLKTKYEEIIKRPETLKDLCHFIGQGDWNTGMKIIDKKLNRTK